MHGNNQVPADAAGEIALDFGTSNTCMGLRRGETPPIHLPLLPGEQLPVVNKPLPDLTWVAGTDVKGFRERAEFFFQTFQNSTAGPTDACVPSELLHTGRLGPGLDPEKYVFDNKKRFAE